MRNSAEKSSFEKHLSLSYKKQRGLNVEKDFLRAETMGIKNEIYSHHCQKSHSKYSTHIARIIFLQVFFKGFFEPISLQIMSTKWPRCEYQREV